MAGYYEKRKEILDEIPRSIKKINFLKNEKKVLLELLNYMNVMRYGKEKL